METREASRRQTVGGHVLAVAWRLGVVLLGLTLLYLGVANLVLAGGFISRFTAKSDDIRIEYDSAYSVWPGRVHVRNLRVRMEDHNVQFLIVVERGFLDVSLHELLKKRLHALRVDGENVTYRMRHKLSHVGKEALRVAAYPPIPGFADPPLFVGPPSPPIPDSEYDLWDVRIDNVTARVKEIWVLEYRYRGPGVARGTFRVQPARYYEVKPTSLDLEGGKLTLGDAVVAERVNARIDVLVTGSETQKLSGLAPLGHITASAVGRFEGTDLRFLNVYLGPHAGLSASGRAEIDLGLRVEKGRVAPGAKLAIRCSGTTVDLGRVELRGAPTFSLAGGQTRGAPMDLALEVPRLELVGAGARGAPAPSLEGLDFRLAASSDLTQPLEVVGARLAPVRGTVPDLGWLARVVTLPGDVRELRGRADLRLEGVSEKPGSWQGKGRIDLRRASASVGGRATDPLDASLVFPDLEASTSGRPSVQGNARLHVSQAAALLPLVSPSPFLRTLEKGLLDLGPLDASARFAAGELFRLDRVEARSGIARLRGHLVAGDNGPDGAFLLSTPAANLGVRIGPDGTSMKPLVSDDWLGPSGKRGALRRTGRGDSPRALD